MKKLSFILICILLVCCNSDDSNSDDAELIGDWRLIELLSDPGNGSGSFNSVESDFIITFLSDGTFTANGDFCNMLDETNSPSTGIYSEIEFTITPDNCENSIPNWNYAFVINGDKLIVNFPCIEPCKVKYQKQ
ncbi:hypothetical protein H8K90_08750 [Winogradskyella echinorum]|uniref:Lipocalin-like domain-containing protein n=1 Tax=Winogradskyella echinorum TaxID=538189 RepID=A0ABR6Y143_9FLAO|nr:hypothetical protein [Winogradskyella echinorum]MBC3846466.1 hypothetical protein [Winogradskyella echinorum]MBC5750814.1 hypothetical protein [Winogradskyella echinorum]